MYDFSLKYYKKLCQFLLEQGYEFATVEEFYKDSLYKKNKKIIIMRHDVDRLPYNALKMAELEWDMSINSTYYFRHIRSVFKKEIIKSIFNLGHEIGYHYETLSKASGDKKCAISLFENELNDFRSIVPITTICMHGSPLSPYDNCDMWKDYNFKDYDILADIYLSLDYSKITYFSDTSRTWGDSSLNLRDRVSTSAVNLSHLKSTQSLIFYIKKNQPKTLIILAHPERWAYSVKSYATSLILDIAANTIKSFIKLTRV